MDLNREPFKTLQGRGDVVIFFISRHESGSCVKSGPHRGKFGFGRAGFEFVQKFKAVESVVSVLLDVILHIQVGVQSDSQRFDRARRGENTFQSVNGF
ncbi:hypothetical protein NDU88_007712 [Pleurodeles waltl]|uniref:Uncharacterized protein n=1 Tax=Pleurodeles waltl TaxID=8319 RepID=A0AAV7NC71_PLEWA|nr:hypothetical protein NDU88_007712 [Pleurodeles waltl]